MVESERRFRPGENAAKPWGGNVADDPFAKALNDVAEFRGLETQTALAVALGKGKIGQRAVSKWYGAVHVPTPADFGNILVVLDPPEPCRERLVSAYANKIMQGKGINGSWNEDRLFELSKKRIKTPIDEVGKWIVDFCEERKISLESFFKRIGAARRGVSTRFTLGTILAILENVQTAFETSDEQMKLLRSAVAKKIERETIEGRRFAGLRISFAGYGLRRPQQDAACKTYTPVQAAEELHVSRERIRLKRVKFGLPLLLTKEDLDLIQGDL